MTDKIFEKKKKIIDMFSDVLKEADPYVEKAELTKISGMDFVIVTVKNGAQYKINVDADSYSAMLYDVINVMRYK